MLKENDPNIFLFFLVLFFVLFIIYIIIRHLAAKPA
jgi:hypothetical protein